MNHWVMAFPSLVYFTSIGACPSLQQASGDTLTNVIDVAMGITDICQNSGTGFYTATGTNSITAYLSVCLSLNTILTLMIVIRLMVHIKDIQKTLGASDGSGARLHTVTGTVATMLIESYALYATALLVYIIPWAVDSPVMSIFSGTIGATQVCAVFNFPDVVKIVYSRSYTGHRSISDHSMSCQAESIDERVDFRDCGVDPFQEPRVGGRR